MTTYKFVGVYAQNRKAFVTAISEILGVPSRYMRTPTYSYQIADYNVDRNGVLTGEYNLRLFVALQARGYEQEPSTTFHLITSRGTLLMQERFDTAEQAEIAGYSIAFGHNDHVVYSKPSGEGEHSKYFALVGVPLGDDEAEVEGIDEIGEIMEATDDEEIVGGISDMYNETGYDDEVIRQDEEIVENAGIDACAEITTATETLDAAGENMPEAEELDEYGKPEQEMPADPADDTTSVCIEIPMSGFTPDALDNLCKMVSAKEPLIKKALGVDELPIIVRGDKIAFDWFGDAEGANLTAYAQFITLLCETAKNKKRVTAKPQENFENERFTMRVWLIGLGMIGAEFALARKLLVSPLSGDAAWRYGKPERLLRTPVSAPASLASGRIIFADDPATNPSLDPAINPAPIASDWAYIEKEKAAA